MEEEIYSLKRGKTGSQYSRFFKLNDNLLENIMHILPNLKYLVKIWKVCRETNMQLVYRGTIPG